RTSSLSLHEPLPISPMPFTWENDAFIFYSFNFSKYEIYISLCKALLYSPCGQSKPHTVAIHTALISLSGNCSSPSVFGVFGSSGSIPVTFPLFLSQE